MNDQSDVIDNINSDVEIVVSEEARNFLSSLPKTQFAKHVTEILPTEEELNAPCDTYEQNKKIMKSLIEGLDNPTMVKKQNNTADSQSIGFMLSAIKSLDGIGNGVGLNHQEINNHTPTIEKYNTTRQTTPSNTTQRWSVSVNESSKVKKYNIIGVDGFVIADNMMLEETAIGITKLLNSGKKINSVEITHLLECEVKYTNSINEMLFYNKKKKNSLYEGKSSDHSTYDGKYKEAQNIAVNAKKRAVKIFQEIDNDK